MNIDDCGIKQVTMTIDNIGLFLEKIRTIGKESHTHVIIFNAELMAGMAHVTAALFHAIRADSEGRRISRSLEMESLLYASGSRQCVDGMLFGVHKERNFAYLCLCPWRDGAWDTLSKIMSPCEGEWDTISGKKAILLMKLFGISREELDVSGRQKIKDLVLERVALLDVSR
ncbi:MAG TPA: KEOPS complex subunit Cgi121 [Methanoregulaceae archaeon]|nr:KEOPS complex subunit Cgi121 [Methanoregulaceae archaeon]